MNYANTNVMGTCSRCKSLVVFRDGEASCTGCGAVPKPPPMPIIETELPPSKPQLLNE